MDKPKTSASPKKGSAAPTGKQQPRAGAEPPQPEESEDSLSGALESAKYVGLFGLPSTDGRVRLGQNIEILPSRPRPELASHGCVAYEAYDKKQGVTLLAQLATPQLVPRITSVGSFKNIKNMGMLRVHEAGVVYFTPDQRQYFAVVTDIPPQKRLMETVDSKPLFLDEDQITSALIKPVVSVLNELHSIDMIHGAITPENIFFTGAENNYTAVLGEALSSAPFVRHHPLYETIERGMAQPSGRGIGTIKNDLYCLGICIALAIRGENLMAGKSADEIIRHKMMHGSYNAMVGRERVPGRIAELLRGLLNDDERSRWDLESVHQWMEGRHTPSKQLPNVVKAARPFAFHEEKVWDLRTLAMLFAQNVGEAAILFEKDQFLLWIKRNFDDKILLDRINKAINDPETLSKDKQVASVISALDPLGPVRYKGLSLFPQSYGTALAEAMVKGEDLQPYGELISFQLMTGWINQRPDDILDASNTVTTIEKCRNYLTQRMMGYGLERIVYTLSKEVVCLSPMLTKYFISGPGQLLLALDQVAGLPNRPESVLDRHIIAFLSVREQKTVEPYLGYIISKERSSQALGVLQSLAAIQKRFKIGAVPQLGRWMLSSVEPVLERFYDRDLRAEIAKRLGKMPEPGDLNATLDMVDNPAILQDDTNRFMMARREYAGLSIENLTLNDRMKKKHLFGIDAGRQVAMLLSVFFSVCCICAFLLFYFMGK